MKGAGPNDLQDLLDARAESNRLLTELTERVVELTEDVSELTEEIKTRPSHAEIRRNRRIVIFFLALFGMMLMHLQDEHAELCGPGARTEATVDEFIAGTATLESLQRTAAESVPAICDVARPLHSHSTDREEERLLGASIYLLMIAGGAYYSFRSPVANKPVVDPEPVDPK